MSHTVPDVVDRIETLGSSTHTFEQLAGRCAQSTSESDNVHQGDIPFTTFDPADIRPMEVSNFCQLLLRYTFGPPQFEDVPAESSLGVASHPGILGGLTTIRRQTISSISGAAIGN